MKKKTLLSAITLMLSSAALFAQSIELRPTAAYTFQETFPVSGGSIRIADGATYGVMLSYILDGKVDVNFAYQVQPGTFDIQRYPSFTGDKDNEVNINNYQLGFNRNHMLPSNNKVIPYTGFKVGVVNIVFPEGRYENVTRMSIGINAGVKLMMSDKIGLNLFGLLQSPVSGVGLTLTAGTGGAGAGVGTYSYIIQFSLGGGLVFKLK
jgi:hypothetical protein